MTPSRPPQIFTTWSTETYVEVIHFVTLLVLQIDCYFVIINQIKILKAPFRLHKLASPNCYPANDWKSTGSFEAEEKCCPADCFALLIRERQWKMNTKTQNTQKEEGWYGVILLSKLCIYCSWLANSVQFNHNDQYTKLAKISLVLC